MITWYLAQITTSAERKAILALRENGFTVYRPAERRHKPTGRGQKEAMEAPLFPGYLFVGMTREASFDKLHGLPTPVRIIQTAWPQPAFAAMVADLAFRQLAGEFDRTGSRTYLPPKPLSGPLMRTLGTGLTCLKELLTRDENGRLDLLLTGQLIDGGEPVTALDIAA